MSATLASIVCGEEFWCWNHHDSHYIKFNEDGTGEVSVSLVIFWNVTTDVFGQLQCRMELTVLIAAMFEWKGDQSQLDQVVELNIDSNEEVSRLLGLLQLEITLTKKRTPLLMTEVGLRYRTINEHVLTEDAFRPKRYVMKLEKGNFITPRDDKLHDIDDGTRSYALRLSLDPSPFPPREQWRQPEGAADSQQVWDIKRFASHDIGRPVKSAGWSILNCAVS